MMSFDENDPRYVNYVASGLARLENYANDNRITGEGGSNA